MVYRCRSVIEMQLKQCQCWGHPVIQERKALDVALQNRVASTLLVLYCHRMEELHGYACNTSEHAKTR